MPPQPQLARPAFMSGNTAHPPGNEHWGMPFAMPHGIQFGTPTAVQRMMYDRMLMHRRIYAGDYTRNIQTFARANMLQPMTLEEEKLLCDHRMKVKIDRDAAEEDMATLADNSMPASRLEQKQKNLAVSKKYYKEVRKPERKRKRDAKKILATTDRGVLDLPDTPDFEPDFLNLEDLEPTPFAMPHGIQFGTPTAVQRMMYDRMLMHRRIYAGDYTRNIQTFARANMLQPMTLEEEKLLCDHRMKVKIDRDAAEEDMATLADNSMPASRLEQKQKNLAVSKKYYKEVRKPERKRKRDAKKILATTDRGVLDLPDTPDFEPDFLNLEELEPTINEKKRSVVTLHAVQIADDDPLAPLLPADRLEEVDYRMDKTDARGMNVFLKGEPKSKRRKRGFIFGALYEQMYEGYHEVDHQLVGDVDLVIQDSKSKSTTRMKIRSAASYSTLMSHLVELGESMPNKGPCRRDVGDLGEMFAVGYRSKARAQLYAQTHIERTKEAMTVATRAVGPFLRKHYPDVLADIQRAEKAGAEVPALEAMGGAEGPGGSIMISKNLGNSSHYDNSDGSNSCSIWAETNVGEASNWYFVLPNMRINGSEGVVIKLRHGVSISWDGRIVRHCSSVTAGVGGTNNVYGCMFGSGRD